MDCSRSAEDLTVRAASGQHISVQRIDVHPEFVTNNRSNLALLRLSGEGLALGPETDTMCLFTSFVPKDCVGYNVNEVNGKRWQNKKNIYIYFILFTVYRWWYSGGKVRPSLAWFGSVSGTTKDDPAVGLEAIPS